MIPICRDTSVKIGDGCPLIDLLILYHFVQGLQARTRRFRVLALSATPGDSVKMVQEVLTNLMIAHVEIRSEDALDIVPHINQRKVQVVVVPLSDTIVKLQRLLENVIAPHLRRLNQASAIYTTVLGNGSEGRDSASTCVLHR